MCGNSGYKIIIPDLVCVCVLDKDLLYIPMVVLLSQPLSAGITSVPHYNQIQKFAF